MNSPVFGMIKYGCEVPSRILSAFFCNRPDRSVALFGIFL